MVGLEKGEGETQTRTVVDNTTVMTKTKACRLNHGRERRV